MFPFENRQADISRMLARIQSSNVELLYIQTGTRGAFNSSNAWFVKICNPNLFFSFHISLAYKISSDSLKYNDIPRKKSLKIVVKMHQKDADIELHVELNAPQAQ